MDISLELRAQGTVPILVEYAMIYDPRIATTRIPIRTFMKREGERIWDGKLRESGKLVFFFFLIFVILMI